MKKKVLLSALALVLAITGVVVGKANSHFAGVRYTDTSYPGACFYPATLPSDCTNLPQTPTIICKTVAGSTLTYYQDATTCVHPYYRIP